jgi:hypothetical protein
MKKIESTRQIAPGSVLRLYKNGYGYAQASVIDFSGEYFAAETDRVFMHHVIDGDPVDAYLWIEDNASYDFTLTVVGRITVGEPVLIFNHTEILTRNDKRRCLIANVSIPARFFILDTGNEGKGVSTEQIIHHGGVITELSDREAVIETMDILPVKTLIKLHAFIGSRDLEIIARIDDSRTENNQQFYTARFMGLHAHDRKDLLDFVMNKHRE